MSQVSNHLYEFGTYRLDASEKVLWRGEELLVLPPKVFDTLCILVKREGAVVSKSELMEAVWSDAFVEESNLSQNIYTLRRTLGVDEQGRQFIETVPRRGYRFAIPVRQLTNGVQQSSPEEPIAESNFAAARALDKSLEAHIASEPAHTLETVRETDGTVPVEKLAPSKTQWVKRLVSILLVVAGIFLVYKMITRKGTVEIKVSPIEQAHFQQLTDSGDIVFPTISPNGELLAYVRQEEREASVWVRQIATGASVQTLPPSGKGYRSLAFSPDGRYLFFRQEPDAGGIFQTSSLGGNPKKVADNVWSEFSLSPDGSQFVFVRRDTERHAHLLIISNVDGSGEREINAKETPLDYRGTPSWSPDGSKVVIAAGLQEQSLPKLLLVDIATGAETVLNSPKWRAISHAMWMPNGKHIVVSARETNESSSQIWILSYPDGEVRRLTNDLESYFWLSISADGRFLVTRQQRINAHLWLLPDGDAKKAKQLTFGVRSLDGYVGLACAPDDKMIFSVRSGETTDLYSMKADGSDRIQLTANAGQDNNFPAVSQDGRFVVFTSTRTGATQIWRMDGDGRNQKQLTFGDETRETAQYPALSPDGSEVFFIKRGAGPSAIWKVPIDGGAPVQVSHLTHAAAEGFLSISPDGKWLAYRHVSVQPGVKSDERTLRIGTIPVDGIGEPKFFDLPIRRPVTQWTTDSTAFDYPAGTFNSSRLVRQRFTGGEPQLICEVPDRIFNLAWSRDRKNLFVSRGRQQGDAILITNLP